jgi:iron(III) transport system permease protein
MSSTLVIAGTIGLASLLATALAIDIGGWTWPALAGVFGPLPGRQPGLGYGALLTGVAALMFLCEGLALRGWVKGDRFVAGAIGLAITLVGLFTLYPLARWSCARSSIASGNLSLAALLARIVVEQVWGVGGVVWNTLELGLLTATSATFSRCASR